MIRLVVALDKNFGMAKDGKLAWHNSKEFNHFKNITFGTTCIVGRKTFDEIEEFAKDGKVLTGRQVIVLSSNHYGEHETYDNVIYATNIDEAMSLAKTYDSEISVIGGKQLYYDMLPEISTAYVTIMNGEYNCDNFFDFSKFFDKRCTVDTYINNEEFKVLRFDYELNDQEMVIAQ